MRITITGRHLDVGAALSCHVEDELAPAVGKFFDRAIDAHVTFGKRAAFFSADIAVHIGRGIEAHASGESDDAYRAFAEALGNLAKRLRRNKARLRDHRNAEARSVESEQAQHFIIAGPADDAASDADTAAAEAGSDHLVIAEVQTEIPRLTVGEAVMHLDLGKQPALLFRNAGHGGMNMIYRRADGHIGWVDPGAASMKK